MKHSKEIGLGVAEGSERMVIVEAAQVIDFCERMQHYLLEAVSHDCAVALNCNEDVEDVDADHRYGSRLLNQRWLGRTITIKIGRPAARAGNLPGVRDGHRPAQRGSLYQPAR